VDEESWLHAIRGGFSWSFSKIQGFTNMFTSPSTDPGAWHDLILQSFPGWTDAEQQVLLQGIATKSAVSMVNC